MTRPSSRYGRGRTAIGVGFLVLFMFAVGVFLLPFAFPTEGAIVARFASVAQFSPNTPGGRPAAGIAIEMRDPGRLRLTVTQGSALIRTLIPTRSVRKGWITASWDGTNDAGQPVPDGVYTLELAATSGKKGYAASRRATVNRSRPPAPVVTTISANLGALPAGIQCALTVIPSTYARFTFVAHALPNTNVIGGPVFVDQGTAYTWNWTGHGHGGQVLAPGLYAVTASEVSVNGFVFAVPTTCWIGNLLGTVEPTALAPGAVAHVHLTTPQGLPLPPGTPVILQLFHRIGTPGANTRIVGSPAGAPIATTAGRAAIAIPAKALLPRLWIRARALHATALIALGAPT